MCTCVDSRRTIPYLLILPVAVYCCRRHTEVYGNGNGIVLCHRLAPRVLTRRLHRPALDSTLATSIHPEAPNAQSPLPHLRCTPHLWCCSRFAQYPPMIPIGSMSARHSTGCPRTSRLCKRAELAPYGLLAPCPAYCIPNLTGPKQQQAALHHRHHGGTKTTRLGKRGL